MVAVSRLYETEPVGGPAGQGLYLNLVVELATNSGPGSPRGGPAARGGGGARAWAAHGPRTLDVDVLLVGDAVVDDDDLVVPHPRMFERRFVVEPLAELAPESFRPVPEKGLVGRSKW